ncbi:MAG: TIM barrel protein [Actinobacteria bacterium]|nr:MAG: TIM barrel protein [Actinomycetota bacterium]
MSLGINLGFAIKRWPEPAQWAQLACDELGLKSVQFSFDLLDRWWPEYRSLAHRVRDAADAHGLAIHSAQVGFANDTYNGLLHPDPAARAAAHEWWRRAIAVAAEMGASAGGGPVGAVTVAELAKPGLRERRYHELVESLLALAEHARAEGLTRCSWSRRPCRARSPRRSQKRSGLPLTPATLPCRCATSWTSATPSTNRSTAPRRSSPTGSPRSPPTSASSTCRTPTSKPTRTGAGRTSAGSST